MNLKQMNLGSPKEVLRSSTEEKEIPGMISIYLVQMANGFYYAGESGGGGYPKTTPYWHQADFMFAYAGLLRAKELASKYKGKVCIINCTQVQAYKE